jgi:hypothetical protein
VIFAALGTEDAGGAGCGCDFKGKVSLGVTAGGLGFAFQIDEGIGDGRILNDAAEAQGGGGFRRGRHAAASAAISAGKEKKAYKEKKKSPVQGGRPEKVTLMWARWDKVFHVFLRKRQG